MTAELVRAPIFVVGAGRSGTTLVSSALSAHSRMAVTPETHFLHIARPYGGLAARLADPDAFWSRYREHPRFRDLGVDPGRARALFDARRDTRLAAVFRAILAAYLERCGKERVGEKTPGHTRYLVEILAEFPDARIVFIQRDPRAVVASQLKTPWVLAQMRRSRLRDGLLARSRLRQVAFYAANWRRVYEDIWPSVAGDERVALFRYEDLVALPAEEFARMCAFLGEAFEPAMLERREAASPRPAADATLDAEWRSWRVTHEERSRAPLSDASVERWREELGPSAIALVEGSCARPMQSAGYAPVSPSWRRGGGRLGTPLIGAMARVEERTRKALGRSSPA